MKKQRHYYPLHSKKEMASIAYDFSFERCDLNIENAQFIPSEYYSALKPLPGFYASSSKISDFNMNGDFAVAFRSDSADFSFDVTYWRILEKNIAEDTII